MPEMTPAERRATTAPLAFETVEQGIGNTPLVRLNTAPQSLGIVADVYAKCEFFSAGGSIKDRIALRMISQAEQSGLLVPGRSVIIEPTSGNTGIGLALVAAIRGYRTIITLPEKMSMEKVSVLKALGAEIVRTPTDAAWDSPESHIGVARKLRDEIPHAVILDQYGNENNPIAHELGTGPEIIEQLQGRKIDMFVAGAGTGGTITGAAKTLRRVYPNVEIVGVDPVGSILAGRSDEEMKQYQVEGIGYDFVPDVLDRSQVDTWVKTNDKESFLLARKLIREEGLLVGGSSGSAMAGVVEAARKLKKGQVCVVILPDSVRNYVNKFIQDEWMQEHGFLDNQQLLDKHETQQQQSWKDATVRSLDLKPIITIDVDETCTTAIDLMKREGFDQLPVLKSNRLIGLVTLGNILSYITSGRAQQLTSVGKVMTDYSSLALNDNIAPSPPKAPTEVGKPIRKHRSFEEITLDTPLETLNRFFFDYSPVAIVTERLPDGALKPVRVVTKVDLLTFLTKMQ